MTSPERSAPPGAPYAAGVGAPGERVPVLDPTPPDADPPGRAAGVELLGEMASSGHRRPPSLVRRADGQTLQLTPILYAVLTEVDGRSDHVALAQRVGAALGREIDAEDVAFLIDEKLRPLGVLASDDGAAQRVPRANPLLAIRGRMAVVNPELADRMAAKATWLFHPLVVVAMVVAIALTVTWVLFDHGVAGPARHALYQPGLLLVVTALTIASAAVHELGHAAACRYGGAKPGAMGAGLYILWPAFYTDVTDSYRLDRRSRLRVDLGGIYFNGVVAVACTGLWALTGWEALLLVVPIQVLQSIRQLPPLIRLDGYHILADLTGVPDLYAHIKPVLLGLLPSRWGSPESNVLRPRARAIVTIWVLLVVPLLAFSLVTMVVVFPRIVATAWDSLGMQLDGFGQAVADTDLAAMALRALGALTVAIPVVAIPYLVSRVARRFASRLWAATEGRPRGRAALVVAAGALVVALAAAWWPQDQYRAISADERGVPFHLDLSELPVAAPQLISAESEARPAPPPPTTESRPVGAVGVVATTAPRAAPTVVSATAERPPWRVRFNPPAPGEGDNYAVAHNTTDSTMVTDFAASLVTDATGVVDNGNRAYALANCVDCVATAVAVQVLLIEESDEITPNNLAVAINGSCVRCVSNAIAVQLVATLDEPLDADARARLDEVWGRVVALEGEIGRTLPLADVPQRLLDLEAEILDLLVEEGAVVMPDTSVDTATDGASEATAEQSIPELDLTGLAPEIPITTTTTIEPEPSSTTTEPEPSSTTTTEAEPTPTTTSTTEAAPSTTTEPVPTTTSTTEPEPSPTTTAPKLDPADQDEGA